MTLSDGLWRIATVSCLNVRNALYVWPVVIDGVCRQFYFSREHLYLSMSRAGGSITVYKVHINEMGLQCISVVHFKHFLFMCVFLDIM